MNLSISICLISVSFFRVFWFRSIILPLLELSTLWGRLVKKSMLAEGFHSFFIAQGIAMVIVRAFSGKIFNKFGHRILIIPGAIAGAIGLGLLGFSTSMWMVWISGVLFGIAFAIIHPIIQAWALTLVPPEKKATANSMLLIFIDSSLAIESVGLGFLAKVVGDGMTFSYSTAFVIIILILYLIGSRKTVSVEAKKEKPSRTKFILAYDRDKP